MYRRFSKTPIEITKSDNFSGKYIVLKRSLNFKSKLSYQDSERNDFGDINGNKDDGNTLMKEMTTGTGFKPIGYYTTVKSKSFSGIFNGNNNEIFNLYQSGLFGCVSGDVTIQNISVHGISGMKNIFGIVYDARNIKTLNILNCQNYLDVTNSDGQRAGGIITYLHSGNVNMINCINYGNIEGRGYGVGGFVGYTTNNSGTIKIENSCNLGNINFNGSGISYSGAGGMIGLLQYSSMDIELNNVFSVGNIEGKEVYKANLIGHRTEIYKPLMYIISLMV